MRNHRLFPDAGINLICSCYPCVEGHFRQQDQIQKKKQQKKRPLSLANTTRKTAKVNPATELLNSLSSAVEKAAIEKMQVKKKNWQRRKKSLRKRLY